MTLRTDIPNFGSLLESSLSPFEEREIRVPFYLTSSYREQNKVRGVSMLMNPTQVTFRQTKRITIRDSQGGKVYLHWTNQKGRNNDILEMEFSGQTGNINTRFGTVSGGVTNFIRNKTDKDPLKGFNDVAESTVQASSTSVVEAKVRGSEYTASGAAKLANFHNLYSLTREPVLDVESGRPIFYYICYSSPLFGNTFVNFIGHFSRVLDFTDDATNPFNKMYNFGFTVLDSQPSLDSLYDIITQNLSREFINPMDTGLGV